MPCLVTRQWSGLDSVRQPCPGRGTVRDATLDAPTRAFSEAFEAKQRVKGLRRFAGRRRHGEVNSCQSQAEDHAE